MEKFSPEQLRFFYRLGGRVRTDFWGRTMRVICDETRLGFDPDGTVWLLFFRSRKYVILSSLRGATLTKLYVSFSDSDCDFYSANSRSRFGDFA